MAYLEPLQTSKTECFSKIVNGLKPLIILEKHSTPDIWSGPKYATGLTHIVSLNLRLYRNHPIIFLTQINEMVSI